MVNEMGKGVQKVRSDTAWQNEKRFMIWTCKIVLGLIIIRIVSHYISIYLYK
jgi:hypothetical protein